MATVDMPTDEPKFETPHYVVHYQGIFDYEGLMRVIVRWLKDRRYWFHEDLYKHKPGTELGREHELKWHGEKHITDMYGYHIYIYLHAWDMQDVEVIRGGVKKTLTKARLEVWIWGTIKFDYQGRFLRNKLSQFLAFFYLKYVSWPFVSGEVHDVLHYRIIKLQTLVKEFLGMEAKGNAFERYAGQWK